MTVGKRIAAGVALAILVCSGFVSYRSTINLIESNRLVARTQNVLAELDTLLSTFKDVEISDASYLLTEEEDFFRIYEAAVKQLDEKKKHLKKVLENNPRQQQRFKNLDSLLTARVDFAKETIELARKERLKAVDLVKAGKGKKLGHDIRVNIKDMWDEEVDTLRYSQEDAESSSTATLYTIALTTVFVVVVCVGAGFSILRWKDHPRLQALVTTANRIGAGELNLYANVGGKDQVTLVAVAFNNMVGKLRNLIEAEKELRARTQDQLDTLRIAGGMPIGELGCYQLIQKLGQGGMGIVYKAVHAFLKRVVALKVLPSDRMQDATAVARFRREMRAVGALDHPNIVRAIDAGEASGTHFLVMEYVDGSDLAKVAEQRGLLPITDACEIIHQAAVGLQHAHEHGLMHRDIKPSNLMLTPSGQVKILDLGLARLYGEQPATQEVTATGQVIGTPDYMSPEQAVGGETLDIRTDIYSLGCTLYKLLAGRTPFSGPEYGNVLKKLHAHAEMPVPQVQVFRPEVPQELANILDRMLAKNPAERFATPGEVARALASFTAGQQVARLLSSAKPDGTEATLGPIIAPPTKGATSGQRTEDYATTNDRNAQPGI